MTTLSSLLNAMQTSAMDAQSNPNNATTDLASMQQDGKSIQAIVNSASSNGVNLLNGAGTRRLTFALGLGGRFDLAHRPSDLADSNGSGILQQAQGAGGGAVDQPARP